MSRRKARELALQAMFQLDFNDIEPMEALQAAYGETQGTGARTRSYANALVDGTCSHLPEIDALISELSLEWTLERMPGVDRNIARIAVYELKYSQEEITPNVVINEAVELAKAFGTDDSSRFINGILGALVKSKAAP
jgi:transcription antitermination protein NusB